MEDLPRPCFAGAGAGGYAQASTTRSSTTTRSATTRGLRADRAPDRARGRRDDRNRSALCLDHSEPLPRHARLRPGRPATGSWPLIVPRLLRAMGPRQSADPHLGRGLERRRMLPAGARRPRRSPSSPVRCARRAGRLTTPADHYSVLQLIEDLFRLRRRGGAACACTPSLAPLLRGRTPDPG